MSGSYGPIKECVFDGKPCPVQDHPVMCREDYCWYQHELDEGYRALVCKRHPKDADDVVAEDAARLKERKEGETPAVSEAATDRFQRIMAAYDAALAGRDPRDVDISELLPEIFAAVPGTARPGIAAALRWSAARSFREAEARQRYRAAQKREHTMTNSSGYELRSSMDLLREVSDNMGKVYQKERCFQPVYYALNKNGVRYTVPSTDAMEAEQGNAERIKARFERLGIVWFVRCCCSLRVFKDGRAHMPHPTSVLEDAVPVLSFVMEDANGVMFMYRRITETKKGKYRIGPLMIQHHLQHDPATTMLPRIDQATAN